MQIRSFSEFVIYLTLKYSLLLYLNFIRLMSYNPNNNNNNYPLTSVGLNRALQSAGDAQKNNLPSTLSDDTYM